MLQSLPMRRLKKENAAITGLGLGQLAGRLRDQADQKVSAEGFRSLPDDALEEGESFGGEAVIGQSLGTVQWRCNRRRRRRCDGSSERERRDLEGTHGTGIP